MRRLNNKGFTLVEIMVSIVILAIIALFMLPLSLYAVKFSKWNTIKFNAMNLAYSQVEWVKSLDYAKDLEIEGKKTGFKYKESGVEKDYIGIIKEDLYLNKNGTNPIEMDGINYYLQTSIYPREAISITGEKVYNAMKQVDVTIIVKDPITKENKEFSVIGTLVSHEGERPAHNPIPLEVTVSIGEDPDNLAKNVNVEIYKVQGNNKNKVDWRRTDDEGKAYFTDIGTGKYVAFAADWSGKDMIPEPTSVTGNYDNMKWEFYSSEFDIPVVSNDVIKQYIKVDYSGYIKIPKGNKYPLNAKVELKPIDNDKIPQLTISLGKLTENNETKLWRHCGYEYTIKSQSSSEQYYFVDENDEDWNGYLIIDSNKTTTKELELVFGLKDEGIFEEEGGKIKTVTIEFSSDVINAGDLSFEINNDEIDRSRYSISKVEDRKFKIDFYDIESRVDAIASNVFTIKNPVDIKNEFGMKLSKFKNHCQLKK